MPCAGCQKRKEALIRAGKKVRETVHTGVIGGQQMWKKQVRRMFEQQKKGESSK